MIEDLATWLVRRPPYSTFALPAYPVTDFLESESRTDVTQRVLPLAAIWHCLIECLNPIWPSRVQLGGVLP